MAIVLTEEQVQLQDSARKFIQEKSPVTALRKLRDEKNETGFSTELWQEMVQLGWAGIIIDEAYGGLGLSPLWMGLIMEEAGRCLMASPLLSTSLLGVTAIQTAGSDEQKAKWLPAIAEGKLLTALAVDEKAHHHPENISTTAVLDGDRYIINGHKTAVIDGHVADKFIVAARTSGSGKEGISLFVVDSKAEGVVCNRRNMVDSRNNADVKFTNSKAILLGGLDQGFAVLEKTLDAGRACIAAEMLGGCQEIFERTIEYLKTRKQFDAIIGSFQALKHRAAIMFCEIELSKSVVRNVLNKIDENAEDIERAVSLAKSQLNETYTLLSNEGVQMYGGIGMTDEEEIGFFMKRGRVLSHTFGSSHYHLDRYALLKGY